MSDIVAELEKRSDLYRASKVIHDQARTDLRLAVIAALQAGYEVADLTKVAAFSRQNLYEIANSLDEVKAEN